MATIQGLTKDRMLEIEAAAIVSGAIDSNNHLILTKHDNTTIDTGNIMQNGADSIRQIVKNDTGSTLTKGTAVYVSGATGANVNIAKAQANAEETSSKTMGLIYSSINNNQTGTVITEGLLEGVDTSSATIGDPIWLSASTAGGLLFGLSNKPSAPNHLVYIGVVVRVNANNGAIFVKVQNGYELDELHDVSIMSKTDGDLLKYDSSTGLWKNAEQSTLVLSPSQITGTAVITTDSRLSDMRVPTDASVTDTKIATTLSQSKITNLTTDLAAKAPLVSPTLTTPYLIQPTPTAKTASAVLTTAELLTGIITTAGTATIVLTIPTGTFMDANILSGTLAVNGSIDWCVINTVAFTVTMAAAASGHTYVGNTTIAVNTSARFRSRKTAASTFITYRIG